MECRQRENHDVHYSTLELDRWMERYQQADPLAPVALIAALSPGLPRFFWNKSATRQHASDLLQEPWLRIRRVRHTYRPREPVLPWIYDGSVLRSSICHGGSGSESIGTSWLDALIAVSARRTAGSVDAIESRWIIARRSGACNVAHGGRRQAEGTPRVRTPAPSITNSGTSELFGTMRT